MGEKIRAHDWAATPFGPPAGWPQSLRSALSICLNSSFPTAIYWGPELRLLYNDAWSSILGPRHPALGKPAREIWPDIWHIIEPELLGVFESGKSYSTVDQYLPMQRFGRLEETYWTYAFTPIAGEDGRVAGILNQGQEATERVFAERRNMLLLELGDAVRRLDHVGEIVSTATALLGSALGVGRVGFGEIDLEAGTLSIAPCWTDGTMVDIAGQYRLGILGSELHEALIDGEAYAIEDVETDPRQGQAGRSAFATIQMRAGIAVPIVRQGRYHALLFAHDTQPRAWSEHHHNLMNAVGERLWQGVSRARAEAAMRESEERHRLIFEQANDIIFTANLDQTITGANPAAAAALGTTPAELVGRSIAEFLSPETFALTTEGMMRYEIEVLAPAGRTLRWELSSTLATQHDGTATGLHVIARDVTERHAYEERQRLLINELNHRVKNMLALVQALALQSFKDNENAAAAQSAFQARLAALASAHDLLTCARWEGATVGRLICDALLPHEGHERVAFDGPEVVLGAKPAVSLVLALHELATNATKYGALSTPEGSVGIDWAVEDEMLRLAWRETGGPSVAAPERRGFGLRMIERALADDLGGHVAVAFEAAGLVCTIEAPLPASAKGALQ